MTTSFNKQSSLDALKKFIEYNPSAIDMLEARVLVSKNKKLFFNNILCITLSIDMDNSYVQIGEHPKYKQYPSDCPPKYCISDSDFSIISRTLQITSTDCLGVPIHIEMTKA